MKSKNSQLNLIEQKSFEVKRFFGGSLLKGRRKGRRPLDKKNALHVVLRSSWAMGPTSFRQTKNKHAIEGIIKHFGKKFGIRIYKLSINSNHIHLLVRISNRLLYRRFIKSLSGKIAGHVMDYQSFKDFVSGAVVDRPLTKGFWEFRPFTRIVNWGTDFKLCVSYLQQNILEAIGFVPYKLRKEHYKRHLCETS